MHPTPSPVLRRSLLLLASSFALGACSMMPPASSSSIGMGATLYAAAEVPPNPSQGKGTLEASLDKTTSVLTWKVTYAGLTGPATAGHFHGPAPAGQNAGVVVPFATGVTSPIEGKATLTAAQAADLSAGMWYVNIHTAAHPGGEIRGQVAPK